MTSTSSEGIVLRDLPEDRLAARPAPADLRVGQWTRLGASAVLGDETTEGLLDGLVHAAGNAARAQGYARGWAEGRRAAMAQVASVEAERTRARDAEHTRAVAEVRQAAQALRLAADRFDEAARRQLEELAGAAVELALQVAEAVLVHELRVAAQPGADALRRALAAVPEPGRVTVRLHPDDLASLDRTALDHRVTVQADPTLARGDAVAETDDTVVNATVANALARVREVLAS